MRVARAADEALTGQTFPTTTYELISNHGDVEFALPNGTVRLREVLAHLPNEPLATEDEARLTLYGAFGEEAIGRKGYSDRDPPSMCDREYLPISL